MSLVWVLALAAAATSTPSAEPDAPMPPASFTFAFINDNYTGSRAAGEAGRYFGPDDFLTFSLLLRKHRGDWRAAINHDIVTSRRFDFRYDLLRGRTERAFDVAPFVLRYGLGLVLRGNFGGDRIQNDFHRFRDIPEVDLPYLHPGFAVMSTSAADWVREGVFTAVDRLTASVELRLYSALLPSRISPTLRYQLSGRWVSLEMLAGWRLFLNEAPGYSEMVRAGPVAGLNLRWRLPSALHLETGLALLPVRNVETDPTYQPRDHDFLPQIWAGLSWNGAGPSVGDLLDP